MRNQIIKIIVIAGLCLFAGAAYAGPPLKTDKARESAYNEKKKGPGEECASSEECRRHHRCVKSGEKSVCVAPEPREIPKT